MQFIKLDSVTKSTTNLRLTIRKYRMTITRFSTTKRLSKAVIHNGVAYFSAEVDAKERLSIEQQMHNLLKNIETGLASIHSNKERILFATLYLADMEHFAAMNEIWDSWIVEGLAPARICVNAAPGDEHALIKAAIIAATEQH